MRLSREEKSVANIYTSAVVRCNQFFWMHPRQLHPRHHVRVMIWPTAKAQKKGTVGAHPQREDFRGKRARDHQLKS